MQVEYLLHHESDMKSIEPVSDRDLVAFISGPEEHSVNKGADGDEKVFMPPSREQLRILASAQVTMSSYGTLGVLRGLEKGQRGL